MFLPPAQLNNVAPQGTRWNLLVVYKDLFELGGLGFRQHERKGFNWHTRTRRAQIQAMRPTRLNLLGYHARALGANKTSNG